jgi:deoxyribose-phosphate aldolase
LGKSELAAPWDVRTLDDLLLVHFVGVSRVGATATQAILEEAKARGLGDSSAGI